MIHSSEYSTTAAKSCIPFHCLKFLFIDSSIIFGISIQLVNNYTGVASCAMKINGNNYDVKINDIYCD